MQLAKKPDTLIAARLAGNVGEGDGSLLATYGVSVFSATLTPQTTSTEAWATTANQTGTADEAARVSCNNWLRDRAPITAAPISGGVLAAAGSARTIRVGQAGHPLAAILEVVDLAETARNSGIWKANSTVDGLHPNNAIHATISAAVVPATLGLTPTI